MFCSEADEYFLMTSVIFMTSCRKQKWWEICFNRLKW